MATQNKVAETTAPAPTETAEAEKPTLKTHWPVHTIALLWPPKGAEERQEMKDDLANRAKIGLEPLENPILIYDAQILDGRTRSELWMELANENACDGYFRNHKPRTEKFSPDKDGTIQAWMRAKSRNMIVRQTPADQRAAIFVEAIKSYPELQTIVGKIKEENLENQKRGKPLAAGGTKGSTVKQLADKAGVGTTTMKEAQQLAKVAPEKLAAVAAGKTSTKKELQKIKQQKQTSKKATSTQAGKKPRIGDVLEIVHQGLLMAEEATQVSQKSNAVFLVVNGFKVKLTVAFV